jgi:hypothetical protein
VVPAGQRSVVKASYTDIVYGLGHQGDVRSVLQLLGGNSLFFLNAATESAAISRLLFLNGSSAGLLDVFLGGSVETLFEDRLDVVVLELGLEVVQSFVGRVGATAILGEFESIVTSFVSISAPV